MRQTTNRNTLLRPPSHLPRNFFRHWKLPKVTIMEELVEVQRRLLSTRRAVTMRLGRS